MAINLNIKTFRTDGGGIGNKLAQSIVNKVENKLENAVEDALGKVLSKVGLPSSVASEISHRFGDAFSSGGADKFFGTSTAEQDRLKPDQIRSSLVEGLQTETVLDAQQAAMKAGASAPGLVQFPSNLGKYYIMFRFNEYARSAPYASADLKHYMSVALPFPKQLSETFNNDVSAKPQGTIGAIYDAALTAKAGGADAIKAQKVALIYNAASSMLGEYKDAIGQFAGAIPNPHLQTMYNGVNMKSHQFEWTFAPKTPAESKQLLDVVFQLKQNSLAAYSNSGTAALQYPPIVEIVIKPEETAKIMLFKRCLISSLTVNYSPQGNPSFFRGTSLPTFISIAMEMMETEIHTANDYGAITGQKEGNTRGDNLTNLANNIDEGIGKIAGVGDAWNSTKSAVDKGIDAFTKGVSGSNK